MPLFGLVQHKTQAGVVALVFQASQATSPAKELIV
jgi:hypothetical protein